MNEINQENCRVLLAGFIESSNLTTKQVAKAIGCPESSVLRILAGATLPSIEMVKHVGLMMGFGYSTYKGLSVAKKKKAAEAVGAAVGGGIGFASIGTAVAANGVVLGLSAAGVTSGLTALGGIVGGGMVAGMSVVAALPIAAGVMGYGVIKAVRLFAEEKVLNAEDLDPRWEVKRSD